MSNINNLLPQTSPELNAINDGPVLGAENGASVVVDVDVIDHYLDFNRRIGGYLRKCGFPSADVEDATQEAWLKLLENGPLSRPDAVLSWLHTTAKNAGIRHLQKTKRECLTEDVSLFSQCVAPIDETRLVNEEREQTVRSALESLSNREQLLLALIFSSDKPNYAHISEQLRIPVGSIGPTRIRALEKLGRIASIRTAADDLLT